MELGYNLAFQYKLNFEVKKWKKATWTNCRNGWIAIRKKKKDLVILERLLSWP